MSMDFLFRRPGLVLAFALASIAFGAWSLYSASKYQALCEISWWSASRAELAHCDERLSELRR